MTIYICDAGRDAMAAAATSNLGHVSMCDDWTTNVTRMTKCFTLDQLEFNQFTMRYWSDTSFRVIEVNEKTFALCRATAVKIKR